MGWKAEADKIYEEGVVKDSLARLAKRVDLSQSPFSEEELQTLAKRARESFMGSEKKKERLERYKAHLSRTYGLEVVQTISARLTEINNEIGYEEK